MKKLIIATLAVALAAGVSINSYAATTGTNLEVSATVTEVCTITTTPVVFGEYVTGFGNVLKDATGTVETNCTIGTDSGYVTLGQGLYKIAGSDDAPQRLMKNAGTDKLAYSLSFVSSGGTEWGNTPTTGEATATGTGADTTLTVYGRIAAGQNKPAGSYVDTVVATVTW